MNKNEVNTNKIRKIKLKLKNENKIKSGLKQK